MTRHLDFGNDLDVSRRRVAHDLDVVGARIKSAAVRPSHQRPRAECRLQECFGIERVPASGTHRRQLRQTGDFDAPPFVVRQVHVEDVELVARHHVEGAQYRRLWVEIARDVEHEPAVAEARRVHDIERG